MPLGFSRVYVKVSGEFSFEKWFEGLREGRSFVTTGPMLLVKVKDRDPGFVFRGDEGGAGEYRVRGTALGAAPLQKIEIVVNGRVARTLEPRNLQSDEGAFESPFDESLTLEGSSWIAVRAFEERPGGRVRFAHTGPFHVEVPASPLRPSKDEVGFLIRRVRDEILRSKDVLPPEAIEEYEQALEVYEEIAKTAR